MTKQAVLIGLIAGVIGAGIRAERVVQAGEFKVPGHGILRIAVPATWQVQSRSIPDPASVLLKITPRNGKGFDVQVTAVWLDAKKLSETTSASIKANMQKASAQLLPQAVEKTAALVELRGSQAIGWYYALTDRNPGPGEFKYLTQGSFLTGELLSVFTILHPAPDSPEAAQALKLFAESTHVK